LVLTVKFFATTRAHFTSTQIDAHFAAGGDEDSLPTDSEPTDLDAFLAWQQQQQQLASGGKPGKRGPPAWMQTAADAYLTVLAAEFARAIDRANEQGSETQAKDDASAAPAVMQPASWVSYWAAFAAHPTASVFASADASSHPRHLVSTAPFRLQINLVRAHRRSAGVLRAQLAEAARRFERADAIDAQAVLDAQAAAAAATKEAQAGAQPAEPKQTTAASSSSSDTEIPLIDPSAMAAVLPEVERAIRSAAERAHATLSL
jgi:hypothetical protein